MARSRSSRRPNLRSLKIEDLQSRELMAADCFTQATEEPIFSSASVASSSTAVAANVDPGSTIRSAFDLGAVEGAISTQGSVSFADRRDVFRFEVSQSGTVDINLTGLSRNVDLVFADEDGKLIDSSRARGRASELISVDVDAGTYFVGVQTRRFWGSQYQLSLDVQLAQPEPAVGVSDPLIAPVLDSLSPLADVQYFGGSREWNLNAVNAPEAWAAGYSGEGVTIAVVDTGVDLDHPDLVNNLFVNSGEIQGNGIDDDGNGYVDDVHGYDFADRDANPNDVGGHGTHVAGTIAAGLNSFGATGVAPDATILPVRVLGDNGTGSTSAVAAGIRYAAEQGADIINLSLGGGYSRVIQSAINYARNLGSFIVAAAGNEGSATPGYPARFSSMYDNVLSVGAHNSANQLAGFSNDVGGSSSVQIDAPGVGVFSTYVGGRYANLSGTSMAAPNVAGVAALALSANPDLTPSQLRNLLVGGVTASANTSDALGIVNAATTVAFAAAGLTSAPVENLSSSSLTSRSNSGVYRAISFDGEVLVGPSDFVASSESSLGAGESVQGEDSAIIESSTRKHVSFFGASSAEDAREDLIEILFETQESDANAVDTVFGEDSFDSLA